MKKGRVRPRRCSQLMHVQYRWSPTSEYFHSHSEVSWRRAQDQHRTRRYLIHAMFPWSESHVLPCFSASLCCACDLSQMIKLGFQLRFYFRALMFLTSEHFDAFFFNPAWPFKNELYKCKHMYAISMCLFKYYFSLR